MLKIKIGDIVDSVSITHKFDRDYLYFMNTSDILKGKIINKHFTPIQELKGQAKKTIKKDDILYSEIRPKNKRFAYIDFSETDDFVVSTKLMVLRNKNTLVNNKYFYYKITSQEFIDYLQMRAESRIGSFPQITFDILKNINFNVPTLEYQNEVVAKIEIFDDKIECNNKKMSELEEYSQLIFHKWYKDLEIPNKNSGRSNSLDGEMNALEFCGQVTDGTHDTPKPVEKGYFLITSKHIKNGKLDTTDAYFISENDYIDANRRSKVEQWDILFSMIGSVGEVYIETNPTPQYAIKNLGLFKMNGDKNKAVKLYYYLKSPFFQKMLRFWLSGSIQSFVPLYFLRGIKIPTEFNDTSYATIEVTSKLETIITKIHQLREENKYLKETRDILIKKLIM
jgi:type I restriction enzyme, S subunit